MPYMNYLAAHAEMAIRDVRWGPGPGGTRLEKEFVPMLVRIIEEREHLETDYNRKRNNVYSR